MAGVAEARPGAVVLDASVVIAHFNEPDMHHSAANELLMTHSDVDFVMHSLTLTEVLVVPARSRRADAAGFRLGRLGVREWLQDLGQAQHLAELRVESGLRMPDVCVLETALSNHAALATFDERLAAAARSLGVPVLGAV